MPWHHMARLKTPPLAPSAMEKSIRASSSSTCSTPAWNATFMPPPARMSARLVTASPPGEDVGGPVGERRDGERRVGGHRAGHHRAVDDPHARVAVHLAEVVDDPLAAVVVHRA